jgi:cation transport ATPase
VPADGVLRSAEGLELDESVLTGETRPVARDRGDAVRAGAFCAEGAGSFVASAVGADSYAGRLTGAARAFRHPLSPLQRGMNRLQLAMVALMIPLAAVLAMALWHRQTDAGETVSTATAAVVTLFPEGLILLASVTYAVAALRMTRRGALSQQLAAIESLASVDVVLLDKTGTLTTGHARLVAREPVPHVDPAVLDAALGAFAAAWADQDETVAAIALAIPGVRYDPDEVVHFSSRRRWSGIRVNGTSLVLGAPGVINPGPLSYAIAHMLLCTGLSQSHSTYQKPEVPKLGMTAAMLAAAQAYEAGA